MSSSGSEGEWEDVSTDDEAAAEPLRRMADGTQSAPTVSASRPRGDRPAMGVRLLRCAGCPEELPESAYSKGQLKKKGKFQRGHDGKIDYGKEEDTAASRQRRQAGVVEADGADHKHTGFGMLDDLDENLTAEQIRQRQNAGTLSVE